MTLPPLVPGMIGVGLGQVDRTETAIPADTSG
jgi:hypothetical protein